jgi:hypothetical protein
VRIPALCGAPSSKGQSALAHESANDSGRRDGDWNPQAAIATIITADGRIKRVRQGISIHCTNRAGGGSKTNEQRLRQVFGARLSVVHS